jgi:hypothetical protein
MTTCIRRRASAAALRLEAAIIIGSRATGADPVPSVQKASDPLYQSVGHACGAIERFGYHPQRRNAVCVPAPIHMPGEKLVQSTDGPK